ncbi:ABC transporter ATP-binding protein [Streptomyces sp. NBC_00859]|uniref:ABC transporter ATP-binding protein n=1 Tax=Streptomyces sp. NBC_00859 TaxID=2903682 RepID=UPI00386CC27D|nr:ABC transporter ATP-binding protein [Streptomyces sp. NBC_00859]WSZ86723.1 ABC transporter ATP-binding protein [Streptomyces sp. NBC_00859]
MNAVVTQDLSRHYVERRSGSQREVTALEGVALTVERGEVHGLIGPNGAGKTTLCKILSTVLEPSSGRASVLGLDVVREARAVRRSIGLVFGGDRGLYGRLSARENLQFWGSMYGVGGSELRRRADELLERVGLAERAGSRVDTFSRGMKQRLHLARGLIGSPQLLLLDEPTVGMDPVAALDFRTLIDELRAENRTILLTTHDMAEAAAVCDRVTLIDHGKLVVTESPATIGRLVTRFERITVRQAAPGLLDLVRDLPGVAGAECDGDTLSLETDGGEATSAALAVLVGAGARHISTSHPGLEEVYLHLVGRRGMTVTP